MCLQVNASTIDGVTPLFNACTVGSVACTEILLENGAQPQSLVYHPSPMHEATSKGNTEHHYVQYFSLYLHIFKVYVPVNPSNQVKEYYRNIMDVWGVLFSTF